MCSRGSPGGASQVVGNSVGIGCWAAQAVASISPNTNGEATMLWRGLIYSRQSAIYRTFEREEQRQRFQITERQYLREVDPAHPADRIDPAIAVRQTGPGQAAGAATGRRLSLIGHEGETPTLRNARKKLNIPRALRHDGLHRS